MTEQWVWHLGGGRMSVPMAAEIKRRGYRLLLTDLNPACACFPLADEFAQISVYDKAANLTYARSLPFKPVAVLTTGTDAGVEVSAVATYFGQPAADTKTAWRVRSKAAVRNSLDALHPQYAIGSPANFTDWDIFPCAVKPDNASGSKGFSVVTHKGQLRAALDKAAATNINSRFVVVEELLIGEDILPEFSDFDTSEVALDFMVVRGECHYMNGALRLFDRQRPGIEAGHFNPFIPDDDIRHKVQMAAIKLGVKQGPFKVDFKKDSRWGWVLMEAASRLSGGYDSGFTCPLATGKDVYGAMLDYALGLPLDRDKITAKHDRVACCLAPVFKPGMIEGWVETGLIHGPVFYHTHTEIKPLVSNADRPVFVIADGANHREAYEAAKEVAGRVEAMYL
jgi:hypothetical protein